MYLLTLTAHWPRIHDPLSNLDPALNLHTEIRNEWIVHKLTIGLSGYTYSPQILDLYRPSLKI